MSLLPEIHKEKLNLAIIMNLLKNLGSKIDKMYESCNETTEGISKFSLNALKKPPDKKP